MNSGTVAWLVLVASLAARAPAQDWPQWRGPARDGVAPAGQRATPVAPQTAKLVWSAKVGIGHSAPVVVGERVFVFARDGENEALRCFDLASGKPLWQQLYPAPYQMNPAAARHGEGPKSTPVVAGGRVFTLGISGIVSAFDAASGRPLWRHDWRGQWKATSPLYGAATSPAVDADAVFVHVGGPDDGALLRLDAASGKIAWSWKPDGPGYASPIVASLAGARQVVTLTQTHLAGVAADTGAPLWQVPLTTDYDQNAVTPLVRGDVVYYSGLDRGVHALRIVKAGAGFAAQPLWDNAEVSSYMSTPVLDAGVLYGLSHKKRGQFYALDARTGRTLWLSEGRQGDNAALVAVPGALYVLTTESALLVAKKDDKGFAVTSTLAVADTPTWAHPAIVGDRLIVKDRDSVRLLRLE